MQNVRFQVSQSDRPQYRPYQSNQEYCAPLAMKQHANRIKRLAWNRADECDKSSKTSSTYYSNIAGGDDKSDFDNKQFFDEELEVDELINQQKELIELQMSVQKSLQLIQQKINQTNLKPGKGATQNCKRERKNSYNSTSFNTTKNNAVKKSFISKKCEIQHITPNKLEYKPDEKLFRSKSGIGFTECK